MYQVTLTFRVSDGFIGYSSTDVWMEQRIELPFPPFIGLSLIHVDFTIKEVSWDLESQAFTAYGDCDETMEELIAAQNYSNLLSPGRNEAETYRRQRDERWQELIDEYVAEGWTPTTL